MLWFNGAKWHGFIRAYDGERLRVDQDGFAAGRLLGNRCRGTRVSFDRAADRVDVRAVNVAAVPLVAARRARLRGRR